MEMGTNAGRARNDRTLARSGPPPTRPEADRAALARLWREKRGEAEPPDYSDNLIVRLGVATKPLNRRWFEKNDGTGHQGRPKVGPASSHPRCVESGEPPRSGIPVSRLILRKVKLAIDYLRTVLSVQ